MTRPVVSFVLIAVVAASPGCHSSPHPEGELPKTPFASAVIAPTLGNKCSGSVAFTQQGEWVRVVAELHGLRPGRKHAIHILEAYGCTPADSAAISKHYDPGHDNHGVPPKDEHRHAGDLGNALADASGNAHYELTVTNFSVSGKRPVVGRAVVVHSGMDDGSEPAGNSGTAIGCGVIQGR